MSPPKGILITGTDTDVGKTVIACGLARIYSDAGRLTGVSKPIASGGRRTRAGLRSEDALQLIRAARFDGEYDTVNPLCFHAPLAPLVAARREYRKFNLRHALEACYRMVEYHDVTVVEGVGGIAVPLGDNFLVSDMAVRLGLPILIVARAGLGTINHTLLTLEHARAKKLQILGVIVNGRSPRPGTSERTNPAEIERYGGVKVLGVVPRSPLLEGRFDPDDAARVLRKHVDLGGIA